MSGTTARHPDADSDTFGDENITVNKCIAPNGYITNGTDCNDSGAGASVMYPGNTEICDGYDNDCNSGTADGTDEDTLNDACDGADTDLCEEGTIVCSAGSLSCTDTTGDDIEVCDGTDNDCDGETDEGLKTTYYVDSDGDGYGAGAAILYCA